MFNPLGHKSPKRKMETLATSATTVYEPTGHGHGGRRSKPLRLKRLTPKERYARKRRLELKQRGYIPDWVI